MSDRSAGLEQWCPTCHSAPGARCRRWRWRWRWASGRGNAAVQLHVARGWLERSCPTCKAATGEHCSTQLADRPRGSTRAARPPLRSATATNGAAREAGKTAESGPRERRPAADYATTRLVNFRIPVDLHDRYRQLVRDAEQCRPRLRHPSPTEQGRTAAAAVANRLSSISDARAIDLAPDRNDGYDLTDWLLDGERLEAAWP